MKYAYVICIAYQVKVLNEDWMTVGIAIFYTAAKQCVSSLSQVWVNEVPLGIKFWITSNQCVSRIYPGKVMNEVNFIC